MKKIFKENLLNIISFLLLLILLCYGICNTIQNDKNRQKRREEIKELCLDESYKEQELQEICENFLSSDNKTIDFFSMFYEVISSGLSEFLSFSRFLFIAIPALLYICKYFKSKAIINASSRSEYTKILKKLFKEAYKSVWILPSIILIAFIVCIFYTKSLDATISISENFGAWEDSTLSRPFLFMFLYLFNIIVHSILYVNICLCVARKHHNYIVAVILSFLAFIGIECFLEIAINGILLISILKSQIGIIFNIMNFFVFNESFGIITPILVPFALMIISFIVIYLAYKNKEKLIIECEKNE